MYTGIEASILLSAGYRLQYPLKHKLEQSWQHSTQQKKLISRHTSLMVAVQEEIAPNGMKVAESALKVSEIDRSTGAEDEEEEERTEVREIKEKLSREENTRIRSWRYAVAAMLVMTAAVTGLTYYFLHREEQRKFEIAVRIVHLYLYLGLEDLSSRNFRIAFYRIFRILTSSFIFGCCVCSLNNLPGPWAILLWSSNGRRDAFGWIPSLWKGPTGVAAATVPPKQPRQSWKN